MTLEEFYSGLSKERRRQLMDGNINAWKKLARDFADHQTAQLQERVRELEKKNKMMEGFIQDNHPNDWIMKIINLTKKP